MEVSAKQQKWLDVRNALARAEISEAEARRQLETLTDNKIKISATLLNAQGVSDVIEEDV